MLRTYLCYLMLLSKRDGNLKKKHIKHQTISQSSVVLPSQKKWGPKILPAPKEISSKSDCRRGACQIERKNVRCSVEISYGWGISAFILIYLVGTSIQVPEMTIETIDYTLDYITLYCTVMSSFYHRVTCRSGAVSTRTCSPRAPTAEKKKKHQKVSKR